MLWAASFFNPKEIRLSLQQTDQKSTNLGQQGREIRHTGVDGARGGGYRMAPALERGGGRPAVRMQQQPIGDSLEAISQQMQSGQ